MPALFLLDVATDPTPLRATFRLLGSDERFLDAYEVALSEHAPSQWAAGR